MRNCRLAASLPCASRALFHRFIPDDSRFYTNSARHVFKGAAILTACRWFDTNTCYLRFSFSMMRLRSAGPNEGLLVAVMLPEVPVGRGLQVSERAQRATSAAGLEALAGLGWNRTGK